MSTTAEKEKLSPAERADEHAQKIAGLLIDQLQKGTSPWQRPWELSKNDGMPVNATTGKHYNGSNMLYLWALGIERGYTDNRWLTYKQGEAINAQVRKGEKGVGICFPATHYEVIKKDGNGKPVIGANGQSEKVFIKYDQPRMRYYTVFHASQLDGLPPMEKPRELPEWERHERAEAILKESKAVIQHGGNRAYYMPGLDFIQLPSREQFASQDAYYGTSLHELGHWTGHADRLNRDGITGGHAFGSEGYAKEELVAETASLMLSMELQIPNDFQQHASYVDHWVKILQDEPAAILKACSAASKVQDYVLQFDKTKEQAHEREQEQERTANPTLASIVEEQKDFERARWEQAGFSAADQTVWVEHKVLDPVEAQQWKAGNFVPEVVSEIKDRLPDITPDEVLPHLQTNRNPFGYHEVSVQRTIDAVIRAQTIAPVQGWSVGVMDSAAIAKLPHHLGTLETWGDELPNLAVVGPSLESVKIRMESRGPQWDALSEAFHTGTPFSARVEGYASAGTELERSVPVQVTVGRSGEDAVLVSLRPTVLDAPNRGFSFKLSNDDAHRFANAMDTANSTDRVDYIEKLEGLRVESTPVHDASLERAKQLMAHHQQHADNQIGRSR